jgi:hypothetical protein
MRFVVASPGLERATALNVGQELHPLPPGRNTLTDFTLPPVGSGAVWQFSVVINSDDDGNPTGISVVDANATDSAYCGTLNSLLIEKTTIELPLANGTYYVYAVAWDNIGKIVVLNHQYHDDIVPILLCGIVEIANGKVSVYQNNFENNPVVDVKDSSSGNVHISTEVTADTTTLTIKHSISGEIQHNNTVFKIPETELTQGVNMCCNVYAEKLTVENGVTPTVGFEIAKRGTATEHDFTLEILRYWLSDNGFSIDSRNSNPQIFTFTVIALNANEVSGNE